MKQRLASAPVSSATTYPRQVIGIDLGDRWSRYCVLDAAGTVVEEDQDQMDPHPHAGPSAELDRPVKRVTHRGHPQRREET